MTGQWFVIPPNNPTIHQWDNRLSYEKSFMRPDQRVEIGDWGWYQDDIWQVIAIHPGSLPWLREIELQKAETIHAADH